MRVKIPATGLYVHRLLSKFNRLQLASVARYLWDNVGLVFYALYGRKHSKLRQDNLAASHWSLVGFQTQLKWGEQQRVFRLIPGLERAEFVRFGMIHRNTFVNAPLVLEPTFETRRRKGLFFAGQMSGVEGYVESAASGLVAGVAAAFRARGEQPPLFPEDTALGALGRYIARSDPKHYQPTNIAFGLLPSIDRDVQ